MMKQKGHQGGGGGNAGFPTEQPPDLAAIDPSAPAFWNEQTNLRNLNGGNSLGNPEASLDDANIDVPCLVPNSPSNSGKFYFTDTFKSLTQGQGICPKNAGRRRKRFCVECDGQCAREKHPPRE